MTHVYDGKKTSVVTVFLFLSRLKLENRSRLIRGRKIRNSHGCPRFENYKKIPNVRRVFFFFLVI